MVHFRYMGCNNDLYLGEIFVYFQVSVVKQKTLKCPVVQLTTVAPLNMKSRLSP